MKRVVSIIVNFRTAELTLRALETLLKESGCLDHAHAIIVDNDSGDGSYEAIAEGVRSKAVGDLVTVLQSGRNGGFAFGVNTGIRHAIETGMTPDAIYLLNSDAFPDPGSLRRMVSFLDENPRAAIVGSYVHGMEGEPHCTAFRFPTILGEVVGNLRPGRILPFLRPFEIPIPIPSETTRVDWVAGASMLIRMSVIDRIGLFDEGYFLYYEETDFCRRAADAGLETWYLPEASVSHVGSASTGLQRLNRRRAPYWFESRSRYFRRHHGYLYLALSNLVWVPTYMLWRLRVRIQRLGDTDPPRLLLDFIWHGLRSLTRSEPDPTGITLRTAGRASSSNC
ncbi:MAG: glycosyltransferase family 2 protein [Pseudomonadales bacterium]|nr:glycosyltransferase family 2 protein [Pseudomonadales bacterium]